MSTQNTTTNQDELLVIEWEPGAYMHSSQSIDDDRHGDLNYILHESGLLYMCGDHDTGPKIEVYSPEHCTVSRDDIEQALEADDRVYLYRWISNDQLKIATPDDLDDAGNLKNGETMLHSPDHMCWIEGSQAKYTTGAGQ